MFMLSIENSKISIATTFEKKKKVTICTYFIIIIETKKIILLRTANKTFRKRNEISSRYIYVRALVSVSSSFFGFLQTKTSVYFI